jgi:hypothetical protein
MDKNMEKLRPAARNPPAVCPFCDKPRRRLIIFSLFILLPSLGLDFSAPGHNAGGT